MGFSIPRLLVTVTDVFVFTDGTINVAPLVPFELIDPKRGERLRPGDQLELRSPDGRLVKARLYQLGRPSPNKGALCIQLFSPVTKDDLAPGTQIWRVGGEQ
jgi:hypothetical protein